MKKLCFSLVWHEKIMFWDGLSSLRGCVFTPTRSPGPGTSFPMFLKSLKIYFFLNRKFRPRIFQNMTKILVRTKNLVIIGNPIEIDSKRGNYSTGSKFQIGKNPRAEF